jgi:hypothetical protein
MPIYSTWLVESADEGTTGWQGSVGIHREPNMTDRVRDDTDLLSTPWYSSSKKRYPSRES